MSGAPYAAIQPRTRPWVHVLLFFATFVSAALASALSLGVDFLSEPAAITAGFPYAITLMAILLAHEMGHYTVARVHGVDATLPYFVPAPPVFFIGTFGAFIRMRGAPADRRALFDIGAAGPWAGFVVAIPALIIGLQLSEVIPTPESEMSGLFLGDSILFRYTQAMVLGVDVDQVTVLLHPIAAAAWVGLLVTALNLLPVGQLDGGHVIYALLGDLWHRWISRGAIVGLLVLGTGGWQGWWVWSGLLLLIGVRHPRVGEPDGDLDLPRLLLALLTIVLFALVFMPEPFIQREEPILIPVGDWIEV